MSHYGLFHYDVSRFGDGDVYLAERDYSNFQPSGESGCAWVGIADAESA